MNNIYGETHFNSKGENRLLRQSAEAYNNFFMSSSVFAGEVVGAYLSITFPLESIRNFVKFHFISDPNQPPFCFFNHVYKGEASLPLTSIFLNCGKVVLYFNVQNS